MQQLSSRRTSIWSVPFVLLMVINFFDTVCFQMLRAMMTQYALDIGIATQRAAMLSSVLSIASLVMRPLAGRLMDTRNNRRVMIAAYFGMAVTMALYFFARSYVLLMFVRLLNGVFYGISAVCTVTIAGTLLPEDRMGSGIGIFGMGLAVAVTFSSMIGVWLYSYGEKVLFGAALGCIVCCLALSLCIPDVARQLETEKKPLRAVIRGLFSREALPVAILNAAFCLAHSVMGVFLVVYFSARTGEGIHMGTAGTFYMIWGLTLFAARPLSGKLYDRYGLVPVEALCLSCFCLFLFLISVSTSWAVTICSAIIGSFGFGGSVPVLQAAAFTSAPPARKGAANSTNLMGGDLGAALGGVFYGAVATHFARPEAPSFGYQMSFRVAGCICLAAMVYLLLLTRHPRLGLRRFRRPQ